MTRVMLFVAAQVIIACLTVYFMKETPRLNQWFKETPNFWFYGAIILVLAISALLTFGGSIKSNDLVVFPSLAIFTCTLISIFCIAGSSQEDTIV